MSAFWVSATPVSRRLLLGSAGAWARVDSGDTARESGRVAGVSLFVCVPR